MKKQFRAIERKNPYLSSFACFRRLIDGSKISEIELRELFDELVSKKDYSKTDKEMVIVYLLNLVKE